ncbi:MAG: hypothetical protein ACRC4N_02800, partial [Gammaproteobacteria bacterium]
LMMEILYEALEVQNPESLHFLLEQRIIQVDIKKFLKSLIITALTPKTRITGRSLPFHFPAGAEPSTAEIEPTAPSQWQGEGPGYPLSQVRRKTAGSRGGWIILSRKPLKQDRSNCSFIYRVQTIVHTGAKTKNCKQ